MAAKTKTSDSELAAAGRALNLKQLPGDADYRRFSQGFAPKVKLIQRNLMTVRPFQHLIARAHFAVPELLVLIPKANAKTTLTGQFGAYHVLTTPEAEAYIGASDRGQAKKLYKETTRVLRQKKAWMRPVQSVIESRKQVVMRDGGWLDVLASDRLESGAVEGIGPSWAGIDELHAHINDAIYAACHGGLDKRPGRMGTISTAGANPEGPLGLMRAKAYALPVVERFGALTVATDRETFIMLEWACNPKADLEDLAGVVAPANPLLTVEALRKKRASPSMTDSRWARFHCNVWRESDHAWLEAGAWQACATASKAPPAGEPIWAAVNLTPQVTDKHAAIVYGWEGPDGRPHFRAKMFHPEGPGPVRHGVLKDYVRALHERFQIVECAYDEKQLHDAALDLASDGVPMEPIKMTAAVWVPLTSDLMEAINTRVVAHDGEEELAAHVAAGELKDTAFGQMLTGISAGRTEGLIALGMVYRRMAEDLVFGESPDIVTLGR